MMRIALGGATRKMLDAEWEKFIKRIAKALSIGDLWNEVFDAYIGRNCSAAANHFSFSRFRGV
jgi:hypothetical protein